MSIATTASFQLGAVSFAADGYDVYVQDEGTIVPAFSRPRLNTSNITGASGGVATGNTFDSQEIVLSCFLFASDGDTETRLAAVWAALKAHHQANTEELLTVGAWPLRQYYVRYQDVSDAKEHNNGVEFTLTFIALYPRI